MKKQTTYTVNLNEAASKHLLGRIDSHLRTNGFDIAVDGMGSPDFRVYDVKENCLSGWINQVYNYSGKCVHTVVSADPGSRLEKIMDKLF